MAGQRASDSARERAIARAREVGRTRPRGGSLWARSERVGRRRAAEKVAASARVVTDLDELAELRHRRRGGRRGHRGQVRPARRLGELLPARDDPRHDHLLAVGRRARRRPAAGPTASPRSTCSTRSTKMKLVELSFPDEATAETKRSRCTASASALEQDRRRGARRRRLRRQPAALPLPLRRRAPARAQRHRRRRPSTPA